MRVLVVDDHAVVRKGISQIIAAKIQADIDEAASGHEAISKVLKGNFDIVLLDISIPGRNGLEILKLIKAENPRLPILILTMHPEEHYAIRALKSGASGYITKDCEPGELIDAVTRVANGKKYISDKLQEIVMNELMTDPSLNTTPENILSDRELQIAEMISTGKTVGQIAEELSLCIQTVSTYRARLLTKMNMKTNAEITAYMVRHRLIL